ncbi:MAG: elongation factor P [Deltaproteobacteria bacterium]|nr:elongation factor P [Deltaproteobacteria bacterium]
MFSTTDFRRGLKVELEGVPYTIVEFQHVKPGKGGAFVRTKLRNLITGGVVDKTFRAGEKVGRPDLEERSMQYLYAEGDQYCFMDTENYEQISLTEKQLAEGRKYLEEGITINVLLFQGKPIGVDLPIFVQLKVVKTEPGVRGDTASGGTKPATLETGAVIQVPLFINEGETLKIDTRTGEYAERVS